MADNVVANAGSGGATFATDDVAGVHYPINKLAYGALDSVTLVTTSAGLPAQIVAALPAGANNIGDVDVLSLVPGTGATALGKAIDSAAGATDTGVAMLAVRDDALSALTPAESDYAPLRVDANGALWVSVSAALPAGSNAIGKLAANSGVDIGDVDVLSVTPGTGAGNLGKAEDAAHTTGDVGVMALAVRRDANTSLVGTDGDYAPVQVDANGGLKVSIIAGAGSGGTASTDDAAFTPGSGSGTPAMAMADDTTPDSVDEGDVGVLRMSLRRELYVQLRDAAGNERGLNVDASGRIAITDAEKVADDAAFTVATTKVMPAGYLADETATDSVDEGDVGAARMTLDRKQHVVAALESNEMRAGGVACTPKFAVIDAASSGDNTLVAAVASKKVRVVALFLVAAGTVTVRFESGAGGTALSGQMNLVANTGFVLPYNPAGWFETASNTLLNLELSGAISVDGSLTSIEV